MPEPDLFYTDLIAEYTSGPDYVGRDWVDAAIAERLRQNACRYLLIIAEPGAGKTGVMAALGESDPDALRYFIRQDSTTPLSGGDAASMLLRIGHQLANRRPELFHPDMLEVVVNQRIGQATEGSVITGVHIEDLHVSPFYRTAMRVEQRVDRLGGRLVGVEIERATIDPRLLEPGSLQYLALLDPAAVLAKHDPDAQIIVLIDALDEVMRFQGNMSVLDWLERSPELPPNVRFVLTSRPHSRLNVLRGARGSSLEVFEFDSPKVAADVRSYASKLFTDPAVTLTDRVPDVAAAIESLTNVADGNFAYIATYARALRDAMAKSNTDLIDSLVRFDALPRGLAAIYAFLLASIRRDIDQLGRLEVPDEALEMTPAWEGAGQRMLAILAVARAPLSLDQLVALGATRVWRQDAASVFERFAPLLDAVGTKWQLFHASLGEFVTSEEALRIPGLGIERTEWNRRIVQAYRGDSTTWSDVNWSAVDDYGLLHLAEHVLEIDGGAEIAELVTSSLRIASRDRFLTDLPFRNLIEVSLDRATGSSELSEALRLTVFLDLVRTGLQAGGSHLAPAVLGLMARLGRVEEAIARAQLLQPGELQYRSFEAIRSSTLDPERHLLGPHDGADQLVAAALDIPITSVSIVGAIGYERGRCLESAAAAMAPHDLQRATDLAELAGAAGNTWLRDAALKATAQSAPADDAIALIETLADGVSAAALDVAERAADSAERDRLLSLAVQHIDSGDAGEHLRLLARLMVAWSTADPERSMEAGAQLRTAATVPSADRDRPFNYIASQVEAADRIRACDPDLAWSLLESASDAAVDSGTSWGLTAAAGLWATWGEAARCRELLQRLLDYYRGLGWYGPARDIAKLAVLAASIDPAWGQTLADEAMELIEPVVDSTDSFERSRIDGVLAGLVSEFSQWDRQRALRAARWMTGSWVSGSEWKSPSGRLSALAVIGLDASDHDRDLATTLLGECLRDDEPTIHFGRIDPDLQVGGLYRPARNTEDGTAGIARLTNFSAYLINSVNYWISGREWRFFATPADVLRSVQDEPGSAGSLASWAGAVAAAVGAVAAQDLDAAIDLVGWLADPSERLIACADLVAALDAAGDPRVGAALDALDRAAAALPFYEAEVDLSEVAQAPVLKYLDPSCRALFEASVRLPARFHEKSEALSAAAGSWYLDETRRIELLVDTLLFGPRDGQATEEDALITNALASVDGHLDELQADLLRCAVVQVLDKQDPARAGDVVSAIANPAMQGLARLRLTSTLGRDRPATACRDVLNDLDDEVSPLHRAVLAGKAAELIRDLDDRGAVELRAWALDELQDAPPLLGVWGLSYLAALAEPGTQTDIVRACLARSDEIANPHLLRGSLASLLRPAARSGNAALLGEVVRRSIASDWQVLMEGFARGADELVQVAGAGVLEVIDGAMRRARDVLIGAAEDNQEHLDGVVAPQQRFNVLARPTLPVWAADFDDSSLYLDGKELPDNLQMVQDSSGTGSDPGDFAFAGFDGISGGMKAWQGGTHDQIWRLVDIRWVFSDSERASAYHKARLTSNSEGFAVVADSPLVGDECHVFGGPHVVHAGDAQIEMTVYFFIFRIRSVVVKLFVARGPEAAQELTIAHIEPLAQRCARRVALLAPEE